MKKNWARLNTVVKGTTWKELTTYCHDNNLDINKVVNRAVKLYLQHRVGIEAAHAVHKATEKHSGS